MKRRVSKPIILKGDESGKTLYHFSHHLHLAQKLKVCLSQKSRQRYLCDAISPREQELFSLGRCFRGPPLSAWNTERLWHTEGSRGLYLWLEAGRCVSSSSYSQGRALKVVVNSHPKWYRQPILHGQLQHPISRKGHKLEGEKKKKTLGRDTNSSVSAHETSLGIFRSYWKVLIMVTNDKHYFCTLGVW